MDTDKQVNKLAESTTVAELIKQMEAQKLECAELKDFDKWNQLSISISIVKLSLLDTRLKQLAEETK